MSLPPLALYVHIPWCVRKCPYCDFNSHAAPEALPEAAYVDALLQDLDSELPRTTGRHLHSIFIGGGTPSLFSAAAIARLLRGIRERVTLVDDAEITLEANPGTFELARFEGYRQAGVNRLSIGIQSFNADHLRRLGRIHNPAEALAAARAAVDIFPRRHRNRPWPICSRRWRSTPATSPGISSPSNPIRSFMPARLGCRWMKPSGRFRSRVRPCWNRQVMLSMRSPPMPVPDRRPGTTRRLAGETRIPPAERPFEFMLNALRLSEGVSTALFQARTGVALEQIAPLLQRARQQGLLVAEPDRLAPTPQGRLFLNNLLELFLE